MPDATSAALAGPALETDRRRVLRDPALDEHLQREGYVVFPLLNKALVHPIREAFGRLRGWQGEGFHADLTVPDPSYRREVGAVLDAALGPRVRSVFVDYEPFLFNFLCKYPGQSSELYLHRDWMYVDERKGHRTFVAWVALEDICTDNGQLQAVPGSHRLDRALRGTDLIAPWMAHQTAIRSRLVTVPAKAGDCVVFDNALVHCSLPNLTSEPRLVAAVGMREVDVELVHFRRHDDHRAAFYRIDADFLYRYTPEALLGAPPAASPEAVVGDGQVTLSEKELLSCIDTRTAAEDVHGNGRPVSATGRTAPFAIARRLALLPARAGSAGPPAIRRRTQAFASRIRPVVAALPGAQPAYRKARSAQTAFRHEFQLRTATSSSRRRRVRNELSVVDGRPLIVGFGTDGWVDGPELFIRALWSLEQRHGAVAHGAWLGLWSDPDEVRRLLAEAARCGLDGRVQFRDRISVDIPLAADAVCLPYRAAGDVARLRALLRAGVDVVSFPVWPISHPRLHTVDHLDIDAAATAIASAIAVKRA